jgi:hypothetical protein
MSEEKASQIGMAVVIGFFVFAVFMAGFATGREWVRGDSVKHGHGEYNQQTGLWQWKPIVPDPVDIPTE